MSLTFLVAILFAFIINRWTTRKLMQGEKHCSLPMALSEDDSNPAYIELVVYAEAHMDFWKFTREKGHYSHPIMIGHN